MISLRMMLLTIVLSLPLNVFGQSMSPEKEAFFLRQVSQISSMEETQRRETWKEIESVFKSDVQEVSVPLLKELVNRFSKDACPEYFSVLLAMAPKPGPALFQKLWAVLTLEAYPGDASMPTALEALALKNYSTESFDTLLTLYYLDSDLRAKRLYLHGSLEAQEVSGNDKGALFYAAFLADIYALHTNAKSLLNYQRPTFIDKVDKMADAEILRRSVAILLYPSYELGKKEFTVEDPWHVSQALAESVARTGTSKLSITEEEPSLDRPLEAVLASLAIYHRLMSQKVEPVYWGRISGGFRLSIVKTMVQVATQQSADPVGNAVIQASRYAVRYFTAPIRKSAVEDQLPTLKGLPDPKFSTATLETSLGSRPRTLEESIAQNKRARAYLSQLSGTPEVWKIVTLQSALESIKTPLMGNVGGAPEAEHQAWEVVASGKLGVDGKYRVGNTEHFFHSIPLDTSLLRTPAETFAGSDPAALKLDDSYKCFNWRGGTTRVAGLCYVPFSETVKEADLDEPVFNVGIRYRAWKPEGESNNVPTFGVKIPYHPKEEVSWLAVKVSNPKPYIRPKCTGCIAYQTGEPTAYEELSGWHLFAVLPNRPVEISISMEVEFQTDLLAHADNVNIAGLARDQVAYLSVMEISSKAKIRLGKTNIFNLAESEEKFPLLRYAANLPDEDRGTLDIQTRVMERLTTINKLTELALAEDKFGSVNPTKIQEEKSRRVLSKTLKGFEPQWGESTPQSPVQERRQALAAGIVAEAYRMHLRYRPELETLIQQKQARLDELNSLSDAKTKLEIAEIKGQLVQLCLAHNAIAYEGQRGPLKSFELNEDVSAFCRGLLGE